MRISCSPDPSWSPVLSSPLLCTSHREPPFLGGSQRLGHCPGGGVGGQLVRLQDQAEAPPAGSPLTRASMFLSATWEGDSRLTLLL